MPKVATMPDTNSGTPIANSGVEFSNQQLVNLVNNNRYDLALLNAQQQDLKPIIQDWLSKNVKNINYKDDQIVDLITNWYLAFKSIYAKSNPFFDYLKNFVGKSSVKPNYNDLTAINNNYAENILTNDDLRSNTLNPLLANNTFYGKDIDTQNYLLELYAFFSEDKNVRATTENLPDDFVLEIDNDKFKKDELTRKDVLKYALLFIGGNPNQPLRNPRKVENALNKLAQYVDREQVVSSNKKKKTYNDKDRISRFIQDNKDLFNDADFVNDLLLALEKR